MTIGIGMGELSTLVVCATWRWVLGVWDVRAGKIKFLIFVTIHLWYCDVVMVAVAIAYTQAKKKSLAFFYLLFHIFSSRLSESLSIWSGSVQFLASVNEWRNANYILNRKGWRGNNDLNQFQTLTTTTTVCRFSALRVRQTFCLLVIVLPNCLRKNRHAVKCKTFSHNAQLRKDSFIRRSCCFYSFELPPQKNGNTS